MVTRRPEVTARKPGLTTRSDDTSAGAICPPVAYTIAEFCDAHRISVALYYELKRSGRGPREIHLNTRRVISAEAAAEWRARSTVDSSASAPGSINPQLASDQAGSGGPASKSHHPKEIDHGT